MAVPGSPLDPRAQGCNLLIREGATLIQTAADVLEAVGPIDRRMVRQPARVPTPHPADAAAADGDRDGIAGLLRPTPVPVDELVRHSVRPASVVQPIAREHV